MLCKVTHCAGRVSANTRPHQLRWGDRESIGKLLSGYILCVSKRISIATDGICCNMPCTSLCFNFPAPTQPQGVTAEPINSTAVRASWQEPMFPNGIIRQYIVNISDGSIVVARSTVAGDILSTEVFDLMPYTLYSVVVYVVTVETGEPSDIETVRTSEAGK